VLNVPVAKRGQQGLAILSLGSLAIPFRRLPHKFFTAPAARNTISSKKQRYRHESYYKKKGRTRSFLRAC
jgi:hypothetical protein